MEISNVLYDFLLHAENKNVSVLFIYVRYF